MPAWLLFTLVSAMDPETARRVASLLEYVGADYEEAVEEGMVADSAEYVLQLDVVRRAERLAAELSGPGSDIVRRDIRAVYDLVRRLAPEDEVRAASLGGARRALDLACVVLAPAAPPSLDDGERVFRGSCAACHGERGRGDGAASAWIRPRLRAYDTRLTAGRVFNTVTDGIPGTAMPSFALLSEAERWSVAFYVLNLREGR
jgi:high-affinity iron transporter